MKQSRDKLDAAAPSGSKECFASHKKNRTDCLLRGDLLGAVFRCYVNDGFSISVGGGVTCVKLATLELTAL